MNSAPWIVIKFGGTSVASLARWRNIAHVVRRRQSEGFRVLVVCSAPAGVSNQLVQILDTAPTDQHHTTAQAVAQCFLSLAEELSVSAAIIEPERQLLLQLTQGIALIGETSPRTRARVMALGELMLTRLGYAYLQQQHIPCAWQDVRQCLIAETPDHYATLSSAQAYLQAHCDTQYSTQLVSTIEQHQTPVVITQGFIAANQAGETVLLGRGGSDTSAAYLAAQMQAKRCEIWTDVPGIYTANPRDIPEARLIHQLDYDEAQELALMGAKVLHPRCLAPLKQHRIPLYVKFTPDPEREGTLISEHITQDHLPIKSILTKTGVILLTIETLNMWQQAGFLADVFSSFKQHGISIDLISTSESTVTVSLDATLQQCDPTILEKLLHDLNQFSRASTIAPCTAISLVGRRIRSVLHELGHIFSVFEENHVHLLSQAANDLNLTFVVDEHQATKTAQQLHALLIEQAESTHTLRQSFAEEFGTPNTPPTEWWRSERAALLTMAARQAPSYVYHQKTIEKMAHALKQCSAIDRLFYAIKANSHLNILHGLYQHGFGFECVSWAEIQLIQQHFPALDPTRILFTPNFAPRVEYQAACDAGVWITIDNLHPLQQWPELFTGKKVLVRLDPGQGRGHHQYVITGGSKSKFGISLDQLPELLQLIQQHTISVVGLHVHNGSGILHEDTWHNTAVFLTQQLPYFPDVQYLNLGGGLGVVEKTGQSPLNLNEVNTTLAAVKSAYPHLQFWLEPGRFLVAESGVLLARVTQIKHKGERTFIGIETGMNSLIRPALYGAYHEIVNLTRLDEPTTHTVQIVGPICESGDVLGYGRRFPPTQEGDVILIATAGAYGYVMASHYNQRTPAQEAWLC
ncbi:MAG: diaminopimelate decarboxylase [Gammaproteobacteria bacterium RIFCSPHIGHO2_12_FULL_45_9]|nr:MAG: diaminopimelate decarboxylase [Gammaproteobacteria bacterium RIFCSPHIGHO2_12_FULL_45_9]